MAADTMIRSLADSSPQIRLSRNLEIRSLLTDTVMLKIIRSIRSTPVAIRASGRRLEKLLRICSANRESFLQPLLRELLRVWYWGQLQEAFWGPSRRGRQPLCPGP